MSNVSQSPVGLLSQEEFCTRFKARMLRMYTEFNDGSSVADYADLTAPDYFNDHYRDDPSMTPEECAEADMSPWTG